MKRRTFLKLGAGIGTAAVAGCAGSTNDTVELTYALWDAHEQVGYQQSLDEFHKLNPNINVTIENIPYNSYQQKITAQYISGNAPDVFWVNTPWLGDWARGGVLTDLTTKVKAAGIDLKQYYSSLLALHEDHGKLYGLPKDWDTIAFFYNADHLAKCGYSHPPTDLQWNPTDGGTYLHFLKKITLDTKGRSALDPGFDPANVETYATAATNDFQSVYGNFFAMNGGGILPESFATSSILNSPQNAAALRFLTTTLQGAHVVVPPGETGPNGDSTNVETLFASKRIAMWQTGDWNTVSVSGLSGFKIGVLPMPSGPKGRISVINGLTDAVVSNTKHPAEAWKLVQWLASADSQRILGGGGYVWPGIENLDTLFLNYWKTKGIDMTPYLNAAKGTTINFPVATGIQEGLTNVTTALGPVFLGRETPTAGLKTAADVLNYRISYSSGA